MKKDWQTCASTQPSTRSCTVHLVALKHWILLLLADIELSTVHLGPHRVVHSTHEKLHAARHICVPTTAPPVPTAASPLPTTVSQVPTTVPLVPITAPETEPIIEARLASIKLPSHMRKQGRPNGSEKWLACQKKK